MADEKYPGRIEISPHAIATIAGEAVLRCYGVVGVASKNLIGGIADLLQPDRWGAASMSWCGMARSSLTSM